VPIHDKRSAQIRRVYVPTNDLFLESDYSGNEVRHLAMASKDKRLIELLREHYDFHKEWASKIYGKPLDRITDEERFHSKNGFVFPSFYLASAETVAAYLKIPIERARELQTELWKEFGGVKAWQMSMIDFYNKHGYVEAFTGFRFYGPLESEKICNYVIQSVSFHTLLAGLTDIYRYILDKKLVSFMPAQIHDSALFDVKASEEEEIREVSIRILTTPKWEWQKIVPLEIGWKRGKNWYEIEKINA
jgi:DNA polymerase-1